MKTITLRLSDDIHQGIKILAAERHISINKLYEEISGDLLREHNAETRFRERIAQGSRRKGLAVLETLDRYYQENE